MLLKNLQNMSKNRKTREKDLIQNFGKDQIDLDYANRWNAPLLKKKLQPNL